MGNFSNLYMWLHSIPPPPPQQNIFVSVCYSNKTGRLRGVCIHRNFESIWIWCGPRGNRSGYEVCLCCMTPNRTSYPFRDPVPWSAIFIYDIIHVDKWNSARWARMYFSLLWLCKGVEFFFWFCGIEAVERQWADQKGKMFNSNIAYAQWVSPRFFNISPDVLQRLIL